MNVKFSRCTSSTLDSVPIIDGQLIYVTDSAECYIDFLATRIRIEDKTLINKANALDSLTQQHTEEIEQIKNDLLNVEAMHAFDEYKTINTTGTTQEFFESINALHLNVGTVLLGKASLNDLAEKGMELEDEEIKVEIYPNNVFHATMTSTNIAPYQWVIQYWHGDEQWHSIMTNADKISFNNASTTLTSNNIQDAILELNTKIDNIQK